MEINATDKEVLPVEVKERRNQRSQSLAFPAGGTGWLVTPVAAAGNGGNGVVIPCTSTALYK